MLWCDDSDDRVDNEASGPASFARASSGESVTVMSVTQWQERAQRHESRADELLAGHRERRRRGEKHPVEDFLFTYYSHSPAKLRRWHPGAGTALLLDNADRTPITDARYTRRVTTPAGVADLLDVEAFCEARERTLTFVRTLLSAMVQRPAHLGCFGLHEWAMVYRLKPGQQRHEQLPLRLSQDETDAVVDAADIRCTHFDAYRFFTPEAAPLNRTPLSRESQIAQEQPACLHAGMDVYKWAHKLWPLVSSELVLDAFEVARAIRVLDMEASPYDVRPLGYGVVPVETPRGRAAYVRRQSAFTEQSQELRRRLLDVVERGASPGATGVHDHR